MTHNWQVTRRRICADRILHNDMRVTIDLPTIVKSACVTNNSEAVTAPPATTFFLPLHLSYTEVKHWSCVNALLQCASRVTFPLCTSFNSLVAWQDWSQCYNTTKAISRTTSSKRTQSLWHRHKRTTSITDDKAHETHNVDRIPDLQTCKCKS